jgi:hypothetical protein
MKVKLLKNLAYGKQGEVVDLSDSAAIYLLRVGAAKAAPKKKKKKRKKDGTNDNRGEEVS